LLRANNSRRAGVIGFFLMDAGILLGDILISDAKEYQMLLAHNFDFIINADM
jgi:hypothetical protein